MSSKRCIGVVFSTRIVVLATALWGLPMEAVPASLRAEEIRSETRPSSPSPPGETPGENPQSDGSPPTDASKALPTLVPVEGQPTPARLVAAADGKFTFQAASGKTISLPADGFVRWGSPGEFQRGPVVVLADGSLLVGQCPRIESARLTLEPDLFSPKGAAEWIVPVGQVVGMLFRLPPDLTERDRWLDRLQKKPPEEDQIFLMSGDVLSGRIEGGEEKTLRFAGPLGPMTLEIVRARAVQFRRIPRPSDAPDRLRFWVGLQDGSLVPAETITVQDRSAQWTLPGGLVLETELSRVVFIQPVGGRIVYLSDGEPKQYCFEPFFELSWPYARDRSVLGSWLRSGGMRYLKGLGVHSAATLKYDLAGRYARFEAELALDDTAADRGCVVFRVLVDGKQVYQSEPIHAGDPPVPLRLDISRAQELELVVDYGPRGDEMDRANWLDARLIPAADASPPKPAASASSAVSPSAPPPSDLSVLPSDQGKQKNAPSASP